MRFKNNHLTSWNKNPISTPSSILNPNWLDECSGILNLIDDKYTAYGMGRSYGDCCLSDNGISIKTKNLNRFLYFDEENGILRVESGVTIKMILNFLINKNWILPVVPGTQYVTIGGAIANDVHGKNHHTQGTFGCSILKIGLLRAKTEIIECSFEHDAQLFSATISGLGLTGLILWAEIKLKKIPSLFLEVEQKPFYSLPEYFSLTQEAERNYEYNAAWIDCQAKENNEIRGLLQCANWCESPKQKKINSKKPIRLPFHFPKNTLNSFSIKLFNQLYFNKEKRKKASKVFYADYLFPLDNILEWNKLYGKKGFYQYQCVIPNESSAEGMRHLLLQIGISKQGSFLSVLKNFGDMVSPGMMSFPMPGCTLALDFQNRGEKTLELFEKLDMILLQYGGRLYPAKDARMSSFTFKKMYPQWTEFEKYIDPHCYSLFWKRVML